MPYGCACMKPHSARGEYRWIQLGADLDLVSVCFYSWPRSSPPAVAQSATPITGLVLSNNSTQINNPFLWLLDTASDTGVEPLILVNGGQNSNTLGIEITSQTNVAATVIAPPWSTMMPAGYGGLALVQTGAATSTAAYSSPSLAMCANQYGGAGATGPACWWWQVQGGNPGVTNPPDILQLFRLPYNNTTSNTTVLFPPSINLATGPYPNSVSPTSAGQITVGPQPFTGSNANVPATFTGASTSYGSAGASAGPVMIQPGQLTAATPDPTSAEGQLWLMQSYLGTNNIGLLACIDKTTAQQVVVCGTANATAQIVGVYDSNPQQSGATVTPIRYGRAVVKNFGSAATWGSGHYVCSDSTNNGTPWTMGPRRATGEHTSA